MDQVRFLESCARAAEHQTAGGIGTLGEKSVHAALKFYYEPNAENHEIALGSFVADIVGEDGIIEIQTRSFYRLKEKLTQFLTVAPVTVVYPIIAERFLVRVDPETGEVISRRKISKKGKPIDLFFELYAIRTLLGHPHLTFRLPILQIEEYRMADSKEKGALRPLAMFDELVIERDADLLTLLPQDLPEPFTPQELRASMKIKADTASRACTLLFSRGLLTREKRANGRGYQYRRTEK